MRLKRIQLQGFKSFSDRTVIEINDNITAIVGPNGCGKSNIVDAVRWALGEQSAKQLRGSAMEDVIFHGSSDQPAVGMAEVSLLFDNTDGRCPPEFSGFSEIQVTRRLFRNGESEYLINRTPCRLKDITDLFLGSGAGTKAYSIIEQGRIEEIITMKPDQRRILIEEAAGVSKYRVRRQEALRKMEATRANLDRLRDIITELKRQMNSLNRQAKKAERWKNYRARLKEIELELALHKATLLLKEREAVEEKKNLLSARDLELSSLLDRTRAEEEARRRELLNQEQELNSLREERAQAGRELERLENEAALRTREIEGLREHLGRIAREREHLLSRREETAREKENLEAEVKRLEDFIAESERALADAEAEKTGSETRFRELQEAARVIQSHLASARAETEKKKSRREWLSHSLLRLKEEREKKLERKDHLEAMLDKRARANINLNESLHQKKQLLAETEQSLERGREVHKAAETERAVAADRVDALKTDLAELRSRLQSLLEMKKNYEGCQRGVAAVMRRKAELEAQGRNGTYGLVADILEVDPEYETALEALLGDRLQSILVRSRKDGLSNIRYLADTGEGRSSFLPLESAGSRSSEIPSELAAAGAVPLAEKVRVKPEFQAAVMAVVADALVVEDIETASEIRERIKAANPLVTRDGVVYDSLGILSGGSPDSFSGLLRKNREIEELKQKVEQGRLRLRNAEQELEKAEEKRKELAARVQELSERRRELEVEVRILEKELKEGADDYNRLLEELKALESELREMDSAELQFREESSQLDREIETEEESGSTLELELERRSAVIQEAEEKLSRQEETITRMKIEQAARQENLAAARERAARAERDLAELEARIENLNQDQKQTETRLQALEQELAELKQKSGQAVHAVDQLEEKVSMAQARWEKTRAGIHEIETRIKELADEKDRLKKELMEAELELSRVQVQMENLEENLQDKFGMSLETALAERGSSIGPDFPLEERKAEREELRAKLERIGDVNLTALEEFQEVSERYSFLTNQEADLIQALENLESTIAKINTAYKRSFKKTFDQVNQKFQEVFPRLFNGGKAFLKLTEPEDALESGVEIYAQPPGKKLSSIALLSGGEKALTASALIMALFMVRPSPFCLLDEVDAALDDANIIRFLDLLRDLSKESQLIIITHNKLSMELAGTLYGVTMEKDGVSKIVSVRLKEAEEYAA